MPFKQKQKQKQQQQKPNKQELRKIRLIAFCKRIFAYLWDSAPAQCKMQIQISEPEAHLWLRCTLSQSNPVQPLPPTTPSLESSTGAGTQTALVGQCSNCCLREPPNEVDGSSILEVYVMDLFTPWDCKNLSSQHCMQLKAMGGG